MKHMLIGLDLAKSIFHLVMENGKRKKLKRAQVLKYFANLPPCTIAMEACCSAHYWAREFKKLEHQVLLLPPQHVKAYLRGQKNDYNDAQAILEAAQHAAIRPVSVKTVEQQDEQAFHRIRKLRVEEQTRLVNQIRGLLAEYGVVIKKGICAVYSQVPMILEDAQNGLTARFREYLHRDYEKLLQLRGELDWFNQQLRVQVKSDEVCRRLVEVPGFGPVVSSAVKSWMGDGKQFAVGRDASAALGVVPRQHTSGDKERLSGITKRGDSYTRSLVVHGARSVVTAAKRKTDPLSVWINRLVERRGFNRTVVALANKLIRIAWVIIARHERYQPKEQMV